MTKHSETPTLGFVVNDVARLLRKRFEQRARSLGLSRAQWQLLAAVKRNEGIQQGTLADLLDIEPITLVRLLDRSQKAGLIERRPDPKDRRVWRLFLTEQAYPVLEVMHRIGAATRAEAQKGVAPDDLDRLLTILSTMRTNLSEACSAPPSEDAEFAQVKHA